MAELFGIDTDIWIVIIMFISLILGMVYFYIGYRKRMNKKIKIIFTADEKGRFKEVEVVSKVNIDYEIINKGHEIILKPMKKRNGD